MKLNVFSFFLIVFLFLTNSTVFSLWKPVALNGTNVTALVYKSGILLAGTEKTGIYRYENQSVSRIGADSLMGSTVRCIEVFGQGDIIIAGTDKGLFRFLKKSDSRWTKIDQIDASSVQALLRYQDSLFFVVTDKKAYLSTVKSDSLAADMNFEVLNVSSSLPPGSKDLELRCITMFRDTLFIGSILTESNSSWGGILRSIDNGKTWSAFNSGWTGMAQPGIQSLAVFLEQFNSKQPTFLTNAVININKKESAIFRKKGSDTTWERVADLNNTYANQVYVTFFSNSKVALEHVAADSGVYKNNNGSWNKIDNVTGVNIIVGNDVGSTGIV
jgi:hypothetical protein